LKEASVWIPARHAVAVVSREGRIALWSSRTGEVLAELSGFGQGTVLSLDADPSGRWLVVSTSDGGVHSFALEEAAWRVERGPSEQAPERCALAVDGSTVACGWPGRIEVERLGKVAGSERHRTISRSDEGELLALAVAKEGKSAAWATANGSWEEGKAAGAPAHWLAYSHEGKLAVGATSGTGMNLSWEGKSSGVDALFAMTRGPQWLGRRGNQVVVLGVAPAEYSWQGADPTVAGAWADDGSFAVATESGRLGLGREGVVESVGSVGGPVACLAFARTERTLLVGAGSAVFFDTQGKQVVFEHALDSAVQACARVEVEDRFVVVSRDGSVRTRWLDLAPLATRALGTTEPALDAWSGLPSERAW
jgi:WD40 repeat protein